LSGANDTTVSILNVLAQWNSNSARRSVSFIGNNLDKIVQKFKSRDFLHLQYSIDIIWNCAVRDGLTHADKAFAMKTLNSYEKCLKKFPYLESNIGEYFKGYFLRVFQDTNDIELATKALELTKVLSNSVNPDIRKYSVRLTDRFFRNNPNEEIKKDALRYIANSCHSADEVIRKTAIDVYEKLGKDYNPVALTIMLSEKI